MKTNKTNNIAVCILCGILTAFGIAAGVIPLVTGGKGIWMVGDAADIAVSALIWYYAVYGYRKPHGNLLATVMLINTIPHFSAVYQLAQSSLPWQAIIAAIIIGLSCYVAGRLHKVKQNIILMSIIALLTLIAPVIVLVEGNATVGGFAPIIIWIDLFVAYVLRYKEHKEAGLTAN